MNAPNNLEVEQALLGALICDRVGSRDSVQLILLAVIFVVFLFQQSIEAIYKE